jgi:acetoacetyl-CoA synthetase
MENQANRILWSPSAAQQANACLADFRAAVEADTGLAMQTYDDLYAWSVREPTRFWDRLWAFLDLVGDRGNGPTLVQGHRMQDTQWLPGARINYAENLLRRRDRAEAMVSWCDGGTRRRRLSFAELYDAVSRLAQMLAAAGVGPGDRVAGYLPNIPETIVAMLATASLGAIWSSCSPDFGIDGAAERFGQIEPKVLFATDGYRYAGKAIDTLDRARELTMRMTSIERLVIVPVLSETPEINGVAGALTLDAALKPFAAHDIEFVRLPFDHPLVIVFSSGTTGKPKCIVHGAGRVLMEHLKEHRLHCDLHAGDRFFYYTTCGWMMWNWQVSGLASGATLLLYDGSPFSPDGNILFDYARDERMTHFGTSAKYIDAVKKAGLAPAATHDLEPLRMILSTGSPLAPESFDFVYTQVKQDVCLASVSGGTDILGCFVLGNPTLPVRRGEIQCRSLGLAVEVWNEARAPVTGERGELVCTAPFPSMPVGFWNDPDGRRFDSAYFEHFPGVWYHGDFAEITATGGVIIYGRSDAVLNPGGVRIGTAEIYRQVEQFDEVLEGLAVGQEWDNDVRVILFVRLREGLILDTALADRMRARIRDHASPRHVPARIVQVRDIPRTRNGKLVELAVRETIHGRPVRNLEAIANPEALREFTGHPALQS